ncbi:MAG: hypothetical protein RR745_00920 [Bacilli bacterium]
MIKNIIKKYTTIYEGYIHQINNGNEYKISKTNIDRKSTKIAGPIFYKRGFRDLYVKEVATGKIIPTLCLSKIFQIAKHTFVPILKKGKNFKEKKITSTIDEISKNNNLNKLFDLDKIIKIKANEKNLKIKEYKKNKDIAFKNLLDQIFSNGRQKRILYLKKIFKNIKEHSYEKEIIKEYTDEKEEIKETIEKHTDEIKETIEKPKLSPLIENKSTKEIKVKPKNITIYHCNYWESLETPKKEIINIPTENKTIEEISEIMIKLNNNNTVINATINDVFLTTNFLKQKEEIIEYYNCKLNNEFPKTENAKSLARTQRKLESKRKKIII